MGQRPNTTLGPICALDQHESTIPVWHPICNSSLHTKHRRASTRYQRQATLLASRRVSSTTSDVALEGWAVGDCTSAWCDQQPMNSGLRSEVKRTFFIEICPIENDDLRFGETRSDLPRLSTFFGSEHRWLRGAAL